MHSADVCYGLSSIVGPKAWLPDLAIQHTFSQLATDHDQATCWDAARMRWYGKPPQGVDRGLEIVEFLVEWGI